MGGLALKHLGVQRVPAAEYHQHHSRVSELFLQLFLQEPTVIPSYATKPDFGDCDMLVISSLLPQDWRDQLSAAVNSRGMVVNGNVTSMEIDNVQFDFISCPDQASLYRAFVYFAYNDLGNLMGRVAAPMGFRYGHKGLMRHEPLSNNQSVEVVVTLNMNEAFDFLGYDFGVWAQGFQTLTNIFDYAASSRYFHPDIFLLHNRNATSRIRDAKRKTYTEFLKWCQENHPVNAALQRRSYFEWGQPGSALRTHLEFTFQEAAKERWPEYASAVATVHAEHAAQVDLKNRWNGNLVSAWTGLEGKALGAFMSKVRGTPEFDAVKHDVQQIRDLVFATPKDE